MIKMVCPQINSNGIEVRTSVVFLNDALPLDKPSDSNREMEVRKESPWTKRDECLNPV